MLSIYIIYINLSRYCWRGTVGEVQLLEGHCWWVLFLFLSSYLSFSFSHFSLLGIHSQSTFTLHFPAEFHGMLISGMIKNYIVLNTTYKRTLVISGYTSVVYTISVRLRQAHILVNHLHRLLTTYTSLYIQ